MPFEREPIFHDRQFTASAGSQTTSSPTFVDITGATLTTKDLSQESNYSLMFSFIVSPSVANTTATFRLLVDGVPFSPMGKSLLLKTNNADVSDTFLGFITGISAGEIIKFQWQTDIGVLTLSDFSFLIDGIPDARVIE